MCCRYWTGESPEMREIVEAMNHSPLTARCQAAVAAPGEIPASQHSPPFSTPLQPRRAKYYETVSALIRPWSYL